MNVQADGRGLTHSWYRVTLMFCHGYFHYRVQIFESGDFKIGSSYIHLINCSLPYGIRLWRCTLFCMGVKLEVYFPNNILFLVYLTMICRMQGLYSNNVENSGRALFQDTILAFA
jgi:hypothetical protein